MFGFRGLIRREIRRAVRDIVQAPKTTRKRVQVTKQVVVKSATAQSIQTKTVNQEVISGRCHVIDGDTIVIGKQHIRFAGVDAPELNKPYGKQAKWALVELCKGQNVTAYLTGETSYDRVVAKCFLDDGRDLAAEMVKKRTCAGHPALP